LFATLAPRPVAAVGGRTLDSPWRPSGHNTEE